MDCPRCASKSSDDEEFCWMCGWEFNKEFSVCEQCGLGREGDEECAVCGSGQILLGDDIA
jgi:predicted amidophosphoribosyltransferase|tara:strand:- start:116 stop:295 length:180 start_codon:yes stop_codon:yes gene_type:complete